MDAPLVRAYLDALPDVPPDGKTLERVRFCLSTLQSPDVRYLLAVLLGPGAAGIARVTAAVLRAAGAPTAITDGSIAGTDLNGSPIDDGLLAMAGTMAASSGYQLADGGVTLGELSRREAEVILTLTAFAEASQRVVLLVDERVRADDALHAARPDLAVIGEVADAEIEGALGLVPDGTPVVVATLTGPARIRLEERARSGGTPMLLAGRDHRIVERSGSLAFVVRDETYVTLDPVPGVSSDRLATGIAVALALGVMGIRMREEWVVDGIASLRVRVPAS